MSSKRLMCLLCVNELLAYSVIRVLELAINGVCSECQRETAVILIEEERK